MAADVIINPTSGEIYWNDGAGTTQSISIRGDSQNKIDFIGYSSGFSPGSSGIGTFTIATFNDNSGTSAFVPGTSGYDLGSSVLRWNTFATNANLSGVLLVGDATNTTSLITGAVKLNGGIAISSNASIGQTLLFFNGANYTGLRSGATGNTVYTLPTTSPATGSSVLSSTSAGVMSWVPLTASSSAGGTVASGTQYQIAGYYAGTGASVAGSPTFTNNTSSGQVQILHTTVSSGTSSGALQVAGGVGISGRLTFNQASFGTTGIASLPTMAMIGQTGDPIYLSILEDNSISFEGSQGQLFSISPNLSTGFIWSVNDISGVPLLRASSGGTVYISEFGGLLGIGQTNPTYKLDVKGNFGLASSNDGLYSFIFSNSAASGSNTLQIRSANAIRFYNSGNSFYTGIKSNAAGDVTYTLPTTDGSADQFLKTNGSGILSWGTPTGGSGGGGTGVGPGAQYEIAVYPSTGSSVVGYSSLKNNFDTGVVSITHNTASTNYTNGALTVSGGVGIGGSLNVGGIGASIVGINISNSTITRGTWNGTVVSTTYGGTGQNLGSSTGVLTISSGTVSASTTSAAILSSITDETGGGVLVFNTQPSFGTGVTTGDSTFAVFNTNATTINAFGAATAINFGASTGKATFNSTDNSISSTTGGVVVSGGAGFAKSVSIAGRLQLLNGANVTAFVSSGSGNTVYILPATTPATGTSVLQSDSIGNLSWVGISSGSGSATTATNIQINILGNPNSFHPVLMTPNQASAGSAVSANGTVLYNPSTDILYTPGLAVTSGVDSSSTTSGALQVRGGIGVTGTGYFDVVRTRAIVTTGDVTIAGNFQANGSTIDFGNAVTDSISFIGRVDTDIDPIADNTYDLGVPGLAYKNASIGSSLYFTNTSTTNILAFTAGATGTTLTYVLPIDTPTAGQILAASAISGGRVTLSWEDDQTGAPAGGITTLNTLTAASQSFSTGTSGTDFNISSAVSTHTFNIPDAGSSARGVVSTGTQTFAGAKTFSSAVSVTDATVSTSTLTGALKVSGGVGIGGSLYVASPSRFDSSTVSTSVGTGALVVAGGVGIGGSIYVASPSAISGVILNTNYLSATGGSFTSAVFAATIRPLSGNTISFQQTDSTNSAQFNNTRFAVLYSTAATSDGTGGLVVSGGAGIAGSLYTGVGFSSSISGVILANNTVSAGTYNKVTITAPTNGATLTLANSSSLITSGGNSLTLTTTATSSVTLPTAGTLTTTGNKLSVFATTTSSELLGVISDETGSGALVFNTQPSFGTGVTTGDSTFAVFNTNASTINAFGAATVMSIGANTGKATFNSTDNSISATTGALVVSGGAGIAKSITVGGRLQMLNGANYTAFVSSATSDVIYTLPPAAPSGVGSSYLSASTTGVMAWVSAPTSGGSATPGGSNKQIQYNSSNTFGGASGFEYTTAGNAVTVSVFSPSGTGYTAGLWVSAINGATTRVGIGLSNPQFELEILGEISATNKSFVIDHPTKDGMKLRYGSLEGPENGVYVRGELKGSNIIEVPDHWVGLVYEDSYTVHLTPIGRFSQLYVEKIENYNVFVADTMMCPIHCYYSVWAERKDIPKLVTEYEAQ
jgi:hypothetical protein